MILVLYTDKFSSTFFVGGVYLDMIVYHTSYSILFWIMKYLPEGHYGKCLTDCQQNHNLAVSVPYQVQCLTAEVKELFM